MSIEVKKFDLNCYKCEGTGIEYTPRAADDYDLEECDCYLTETVCVDDYDYSNSTIEI